MRLNFGLILIAITLQFSCGKESKCIKSIGETITENRPLESFHTLRVNGKFDVILQMDKNVPRSISIEGGENLMPYVETDILAGVLTIGDNNNCNWMRDYTHRFKVIINSHNLTEIELNGACKFTSRDTIYSDSLVLKHNSTRDANLTIDVRKFSPKQVNSGGLITYGRCGIYAGIVEEVGSMDSRGLKTDDMYIFYFSPAAGYVDAEQILSVRIFGFGNVFYVKDPLVKLEYFKRGKGSLSKL